MLNSKRTMMGQLPLNMASNLALFVVNVFVGIWMVPYLINKLGVAAYGLIPLANQVTQYATLITMSVNGAVARYLSIGINQLDSCESNRIFNTAFFAISGLLILLVPFMLCFSWYVPVIFDVPITNASGARFLFMGIMCAFVLVTIRGNFAVSAYVLNRLDIRNLVDMINVIFRVFLIVVLFWLFSADIVQVGVGYFIASLFALFFSIYFWRKLTPQLTINYSYFDKGYLVDLFSTGGWLVVNQVGVLLFLSIDLIVVNKIFGAKVVGEYSAVLQWSSMMRMFGSAVAGAFSPLIMIYHANSQRNAVVQTANRSVVITGLIIALPTGLLCGFSRQVMGLWLGDEFMGLAPLMVLMLIHLPINLAVLPLFNVNVATNMVRIPGLVSLLMGLMNVALAIVLPLILGWGVYGVAAAGALVLTLKNAVFTPWYAAKSLHITPGGFYIAIIPGVLMALFVGGLSFMISSSVIIDTLVKLVSYSFCVIAIYSLICLLIARRINGTNFILDAVNRRFNLINRG